jgi:hypothetical protein
MSVINIFIAISIVVVVIVFFYFLYQTKKLNNYRYYDYDIDPSESLANNTYKLLCPEDYTYYKTEDDQDYCKSNKDNTILSTKFKSLRDGDDGEFNYPDFETKEGIRQLDDRCKWHKEHVNRWDAIQPYCE